MDLTENEMIYAAIEWLRDRLPASWEIGPTSREISTYRNRRLDTVIELKGPSGIPISVVIELKKRLAPRNVDELLGSLGGTLRQLAGNVPILVVSMWLSESTRNRLSQERINYFDLTGNSLIRLDNPALFIETQGAQKDPFPQPRGKTRLTGAKAGRVIRTLVDVRPPYGLRELASAIGLAPGYLSRVLTTLDEEALVERTTRGRVELVNIEPLIRRWARSYDVFRTNKAFTYIAPAGAGQTLERLSTISYRTAVTGSFAAARIAAVAGSALLSIYCDDVESIANELGLLPTDEGANVVLLMPFDPVIWERTSIEEDVTYVSPSQVTIDCLTGNGRMPAEGEAALRWMIENEKLWRLDKLPARMARSE